MRSRSTRAPLHFLDTSPPAHGRGVLRSQVPSPPCAGIRKEGRTFRLLPSSGAENGTRTRAAREWFRETLQTPPAPGRGALRSQVPSPSPRHARHAKQKGESLKILPSALERKTDFRPKRIPRSQSAHYVKHSPRKSLPRCGHHALVCIPMLSTKIRNLQAKYKLKIRFCAATAPAARVFPNDSIRRVARMKAPRPAGSYQPSVCGRCSRSVRR